MKILTEWLRSYLPALPVDDLQLAEDLTLRGIAVEGVFPLAAGSLFDMDITTNRVDAMNHYGIAREAAAIYNVPLQPLDAALPEPSAAAPFPVRIDAPELCGRFTAQVVRGVTIKPTEGLAAGFFRDLGQKSISNAVDISNVVLLGMGHPNHVFDLDRIEGGIIVRCAHAGEQIKLLDGTTRTLAADDLVIADERKALSLAGVMGGFESMITAETKNILIEAAWFDPAAIRATSRRHLIHTDASHRYERGADFAAPPIANALVAKHLLQACGGVLSGPMLDLVIPGQAARTLNRPPVPLCIYEVHRLLGSTVSPDGITSALVEQYLGALGCRLTFNAAGSWNVRLPSWRLDLTREIDLIEEIARVYGYNGFANTLPTPAEVIVHPTARAGRALRQRLFTLGFYEAISSTFASAAECTLFAPSVQAVPLENPLNEEAAHLRPSLLSGMVTMLAHNLNRDVLSAHLFEAGAIFKSAGKEVEESESLSLGITGGGAVSNLYPAGDTPIFELKGAIESILTLFGAPPLTFIANTEHRAFEPGRSAMALLGEQPVAVFGELVRSESARRKLRQPVFLAELRLGVLLALPLRQATARELSRFQVVERDFSFVFPDAVSWGSIAAAIHALGIAELISLQPVELWRNAQKNPGFYAMLVRTRFQSTGRTLNEDDLTGWSASILQALQSLGGVLRS